MSVPLRSHLVRLPIERHNPILLVAIPTHHLGRTALFADGFRPVSELCRICCSECTNCFSFSKFFLLIPFAISNLCSHLCICPANFLPCICCPKRCLCCRHPFLGESRPDQSLVIHMQDSLMNFHTGNAPIFLYTILPCLDTFVI
jgi:hypothetical protein